MLLHLEAITTCHLDTGMLACFLPKAVPYSLHLLHYQTEGTLCCPAASLVPFDSSNARLALPARCHSALVGCHS